MLNTNALTTVARLCDYIDIAVPTNTTALETYINGVSNFIQKYTKKTFKKTTYTQEEYSVEKGQMIVLNNSPLVRSEAVIVERRNSALNENRWEVVDGQYYSVDMDAGLIESMAGAFFFRGRNNYRITYTAGYDFDNVTTFLGDTGAADVELATWLMCQDFYSNKGSNTLIKREKLGEYDVTYADASKVMFENPQALAILKGYADIDMGGVLTPFQTI